MPYKPTYLNRTTMNAISNHSRVLAIYFVCTTYDVSVASDSVLTLLFCDWLSGVFGSGV